MEEIREESLLRHHRHRILADALRAGFGSCKAGWFRDTVLSARIVLPDGTVQVFAGEDLDMISGDVVPLVTQPMIDYLHGEQA